MAQMTDVVILGDGIRGLWLGSELAKLNLNVTWVQLHSTPRGRRDGGFMFDDWAWQVGPVNKSSKLIQTTSDFIETVIKPKIQDISVQILTPKGPFEFSGGGQGRALKKFFKMNAQSLDEYLNAISAAQKLDELRGSQLLYAHTQKIFKAPLSQRWVLEWLGSLRRPRAVSTADWILKGGGEMLDPQYPFWLLDDSMADIIDRAMIFAEKSGVKVKPKAKVVDVGVEGRRVTGVELQDQSGYLPCRHLVLSASYQFLISHAPKVAKNIKAPAMSANQKWIWIRCGFLLKGRSRPEGLLEFSSFVIDPLMPLVESNMGLIKWKSGEEHDSVTVWVRVPNGELKRGSFLMELQESVQRNMERMLPLFSKNKVKTFSFEEYLKNFDDFGDDFAVVYEGTSGFENARGRLKNVWLAGPGFDRGLELLSQLATEFRLFNKLVEVHTKESRRDRSVHSSRNGADMVSPK